MAVVDIVAGVVGRAAAGELPSSRHLHGIQASCDPGTLSLSLTLLLDPVVADAAVPVGMLSPPLWVGCCSGLKFLELLL